MALHGPQGHSIELTSTQPLKLRILNADKALADQIAIETSEVFRSITLQEILREAIHLGLPMVGNRMKAACEAAKKVA